MRRVFADTFYWIALTNPADPYHARVVGYDDELADAGLVTTDEVLTEFLTFYSFDPGLRVRAAATVRRIQASEGVVILPQTRSSFEAGLRLYETRPDKRYSMTDCISMQVMRREGIQDVLTADHHFEQDGFRVLFR